MTCVGIKADGVVCGKLTREGEDRCGIHTFERNGPWATRIKELGYLHKAARNDLIETFGGGAPEMNAERMLLLKQNQKSSRSQGRGFFWLGVYTENLEKSFAWGLGTRRSQKTKFDKCQWGMV
jgi:hypothetical protein